VRKEWERKELEKTEEVQEAAFAPVWPGWNRTIMSHNSMDVLTCQV
jgi:hypothetical protein